jgi:Family of unknown function (DUF5946)
LGVPGTTRCPGCGLVLPEVAWPTQEALGTSPACQALADEVGVRTYPEGFPGRERQLYLDAYRAQHPGPDERRAVQLTAMSLMTLCLYFEHGTDPAHGPALHQRMPKMPFYHWLEPPDRRGSLTVAHVAASTSRVEHERSAREWGRDVWASWSPHQATVEEWVRLALGPR